MEKETMANLLKDAQPKVIATGIHTRETIITDVKMPFLSMVIFMIKWAIASIPAFIILFIAGSMLMGVLMGIGRM